MNCRTILCKQSACICDSPPDEFDTWYVEDFCKRLTQLQEQNEFLTKEVKRFEKAHPCCVDTEGEERC